MHKQGHSQKARRLSYSYRAVSHMQISSSCIRKLEDIYMHSQANMSSFPVTHLGCDIYFSTQALKWLLLMQKALRYLFKILTAYHLLRSPSNLPRCKASCWKLCSLALSALPWSGEGHTSSSLCLGRHRRLILKYKRYPSCMKKNMLSELKLLCFLHCQGQTKIQQTSE